MISDTFFFLATSLWQIHVLRHIILWLCLIWLVFPSKSSVTSINAEILKTRIHVLHHWRIHNLWISKSLTTGRNMSPSSTVSPFSVEVSSFHITLLSVAYWITNITLNQDLRKAQITFPPSVKPYEDNLLLSNPALSSFYTVKVSEATISNTHVWVEDIYKAL